MKFDKLYSSIKEQLSYKLNEKGETLLNEYNTLRETLEEDLSKALNEYVNDIEEVKKILSVQIFSIINSQKLGDEKFNLMVRLDSITNGGKSTINSATFGFNEQDTILNYLEKI